MRDILIQHDFDILAISETWLKPDVPNSAIDIEGYQFSRFDRPTRGGEVGIYYKCTFKTVDFVYDLESLNHIEATAMVFPEFLDIHNEPLVIIVVYRPPGSHPDGFLEIDRLISSVLQLSSHLVLLGDFNVDFNSDNLSYCRIRLGEIQSFYKLFQLIDEPEAVVAARG